MNRLAETLERTGYRQFYLAFGDANLRKQDWVAGARGLVGPLRELVNLFLLQKPVSRRNLRGILGEEEIAELLRCGVLRQDNQALVSDSFYLIFCRSYALFCQTARGCWAYFGDDSLALATLQTPAPGGKVLDLCSGPGIQSFVAAGHARCVTGVEIQRKAWRIAELNRRLNRAGGRVRFVCQSAEDFARADEELYDRILFNPPLIPMVPGYQFPLVANGGPDGLDILRQILARYHQKLSQTGSMEFIGMGLGKGGCPAVCAQIQRLARRYSLAARVHLLSHHPIRPFAPLFEACASALARDNDLPVAKARKVLRGHFVGLGRDTYWLFFASLRRARAGSRGSLSLVDITKSFWGGWFV